MSTEQTIKEIIPPQQSKDEDSIAPPKPKRVLTEAQRLAFLKGREKRMANIERKRQEKKEAEEEGLIMKEETVPEEKPKAKVVKEKDPVVVDTDPDKAAEKIAAFVFDKLKELKKEDVSADPEPVKKPKRKYTRRVKPVVSSDEERSPSPVAPIPKRVFSWM